MDLLASIPFVQAMNSRGVSSVSTSKDQRIVGGVIVPVTNHQKQSITYYLEKRNGWLATTTPAAGSVGTCVWDSPSLGHYFMAFGATNSTIWQWNGSSNTNLGTITGLCFYMDEAVFTSTTYILISSLDGTGWVFVEGAADQTSYTGDTHSNTTIDNIASTAGMYVGQAITGSGIQAGTRIATVTSGTAITITLAATATASGVTLTKTAVAKIIDSDFPAITGPMLEMDGRIFALGPVPGADNAGAIFQSDLNTVFAWTSGGYIALNMDTDVGRAIIRFKNTILAFSSGSIEPFYNAGNASGSVLRRSDQAFMNIGAAMSVGVAGNATKEAPHSVVTLGDKIYFIGSLPGTTDGVFVMENYQYRKISDPFIDMILGKVVDGTIVTYGTALYAFRQAGQEFLYLYVDGSSIRHFFYSTDTKKWTEAGYDKAYAVSNSFQKVTAVSPTSTSGKLYELGAAGQDDSAAYDLIVQFSDGLDGARNTAAMVELIADVESTGTTTLAYADGDDGSFTTHPSTFSMTTKQKRLHRLGTYKGARMWKLTHNANTGWRGLTFNIWGSRSNS